MSVSDTRSVPKRAVKKQPTRGAAMVSMSAVIDKLRRLSQDTSLNRWERMCYQTAISLVEKAVDDLR